MNPVKAARTMLIIALTFSAPLWAELPSLQVRVNNIASTDGTIEVSLFDSAETFMKEPYLQQSGSASEAGTFSAEFAALPEGEYAVVVVHDANGNEKLDIGFLGLGGEDYAFSNNIRPWFGRPEFTEVKFTVDRPGMLLEIDLD